ncbi:hypothetical protein BS47DRAFT_1367232 [Hydnum rufescens UP504]|uniref:Uncharacterized protein n=1 Tax=Hydnum rufescens UP504 TaxID=1448309 RepID=A0A9P6DPS5_9AGAM|nr:hypothetical protein BS47DRAFT_1367232 [Hydnum rufescens UP504]
MCGVLGYSRSGIRLIDMGQNKGKYPMGQVVLQDTHPIFYHLNIKSNKAFRIAVYASVHWELMLASSTIHMSSSTLPKIITADGGNSTYPDNGELMELIWGSLQHNGVSRDSTGQAASMRYYSVEWRLKIMDIKTVNIFVVTIVCWKPKLVLSWTPSKSPCHVCTSNLKQFPEGHNNGLRQFNVNR